MPALSRISPPVGALLMALATGTAAAQVVPVAIDPAPDYDYVQQAASLAFDGEKLTLSGIAKGTLYFADRPYRVSGQIDNATFLSLWDAGGTFADDPPNAAITLLSDPEAQPAVVELTTATLNGSDIEYGVKVVSGDLPQSALDVALFVDRAARPRRNYYPGGVKGAYHPVHPLPGPYCYHDPQARECHYHPYHPYYPPYHPYYHPGAAYAAGVATGAAIANANQQPVYYVYPIPQGQLPPNCYINSTHTEMICTVPL